MLMTIIIIDVTGSSVLEIENKLNVDLNNLESWFNMNRLIVNTTKTQAMLTCVNNVKILGLIIDDNISWKPHIKKVCNTVSYLTGLMYRMRIYYQLTF